MRLVEYTDPAALFERSCQLFAAREVEHNLLLGVLQGLMREGYPASRAWLWGVHDESERLIGACVRTPPLPLLISSMPGPALALVADKLATGRRLPCDISGQIDQVEQVRARLCELHRVRAEVVNTLRLFELRSVIPLAPPAGFMRRAEPFDLQVLVQFFEAFEFEAVPHERGLRNLRKLASDTIARRGVFVWERDQVLWGMAVSARAVGSGASIGPVYTTPEARGQGYATALVGGLSQFLLDAGHGYTCLFTDLANPISNRIYPRIGYRPICDVRCWKVYNPRPAS